MIDFQPIIKKLTEFLARAFQKNKYEKVLQDYIHLSQSRPNDMRIRVKIAETYFKAKNITKTIETYQEIAQKYVEENFILKAISIQKNILKLEPTNAETNLKLAELYLKLEMTSDAITQYKIAMQTYMSQGNAEKLLDSCLELIEIDPSPSHRRKLAEIYQTQGHVADAIKQYEILAEHYKTLKQYDDLLRIYELILPHKATDKSMIRDVCILYLRRRLPDYAIKIMERYKVDADSDFSELFDKAKLLQKALRAPSPLVAANR